MGCIILKERNSIKQHLIEEIPKKRNNLSHSLIKKILEGSKSNPNLI